MIFFTKHAEKKFEVLDRHKFFVTKDRVTQIIRKPDLIDHSRAPLLIAQGEIDEDHVLRIVYKLEGGITRVITFYPGRKRKYEKSG